jgi:hypothetical protein
VHRSHDAERDDRTKQRGCQIFSIYIKSKGVKESQTIVQVSCEFHLQSDILLSIMATRPVRFEFYCGEEELKYFHDIPRSLVIGRAQVAQDAGYSKLFVEALQPIMKEYEAVCLATSNAFCENCGSPRTTVLQTPMSWLHKVDDPFVVVWTNPVCGKGGCEIQIR